jgi:hypothetical protein
MPFRVKSFGTPNAMVPTQIQTALFADSGGK